MKKTHGIQAGRALGICALAIAATVPMADGAMLAIANPGFETDAAPVVGATGWTITSGGTDFFTTTAGSPDSPGDPGAAQEGVNWLSGNRLATGAGSSNNPQVISQLIDVSVDASDIDGPGATINLDWFYADSDGNDDGTVTITFFSDIAGTTPVGSALSSGVLPEIGGWNPASLQGTVPASTRSVSIELEITRASGSAGNVHFDNFSGSIAPIPEPSVGVLGALGGLLLLRRRKR